MLQKILLLSFLFFIQNSFSQRKNKEILFDVKKDTLKTFVKSSKKGLLLKGGYLTNEFFLSNSSNITIYFDDSINLHELSIKRENSSVPKTEGMVYFNPAQSLNDYDTTKPLDYGSLLPNAIRFYLDKKDLDTINGSDYIRAKSLGRKPLSEYYQPFYFKKHEVTNKEYREFVNYVKDSIARTILAEEDPETYLILDGNHDEGKNPLNWNVEIPYYVESPENKKWEIFNPLLAEMLLPENERYYGQRAFDTEEFIYKNEPYSSKSLAIYPDTSVWETYYQHDFWSELKTSMYFWHPAYDDYPVVGITYEQAKAFCHWKTQQLRKKYGGNFEVTLPSEIEWEYVCTHYTLNGKSPTNDFNASYFLMDHSWFTDLRLTNSDRYPQLDLEMYPEIKSEKDIDVRGFKRKDVLYKAFSTPENDYLWNWAYFTHKADINLYYKDKDFSKKEVSKDYRKQTMLQNIDNFGISGLGDNVSEWLEENYQDNWNDIFEFRQFLFYMLSGGDITILAMIEKHYNNMCDKDGQLVRGANWFDERQAIFFGKNKEGMNTKTFVSPNKSYATLGFRYIIRPISE